MTRAVVSWLLRALRRRITLDVVVTCSDGRRWRPAPKELRLGDTFTFEVGSSKPFRLEYIAPGRCLLTFVSDPGAAPPGGFGLRRGE